MKHLDEMAARGIEYRGQLQQQNTPISEEACGIGYDLLKNTPPEDQEAGGTSPKWREQVREAYMKACLSGQAAPKPDPSGIGAVSPSPYGSAVPSASPSA